MVHRSVALGFAALLLSAGGALAHEEHAGHAGQDKVGKVAFANSCVPAVQANFQRPSPCCTRSGTPRARRPFARCSPTTPAAPSLPGVSPRSS